MYEPCVCVRVCMYVWSVYAPVLQLQIEVPHLEFTHTEAQPKTKDTPLLLINFVCVLKTARNVTRILYTHTQAHTHMQLHAN